jgi:hypothetical protein
MGTVPFFANTIHDQSLAWFAFNSDSSTYHWAGFAASALKDFYSSVLNYPSMTTPWKVLKIIGTSLSSFQCGIVTPIE